jgi:nitrite reductase/ring-hydroxylating ferredoxin subunit
MTPASLFPHPHFQYPTAILSGGIVNSALYSSMPILAPRVARTTAPRLFKARHTRPALNARQRLQLFPVATRTLASTARTAAAMAREFKLKDVGGLLDLKPGEKKEVEVEGIQDAKVLLVNAGGTVQAIGPRCTHYGAPLVKGVLMKNGRLTCPWHGGELTPSSSSTSTSGGSRGGGGRGELHPLSLV